MAARQLKGLKSAILRTDFQPRWKVSRTSYAGTTTRWQTPDYNIYVSTTPLSGVVDTTHQAYQGKVPGRPSYRRSLQSSKENIQHKKRNLATFLLFSLFWVFFALLEPDPKRIRLHNTAGGYTTNKATLGRNSRYLQTDCRWGPGWSPASGRDHLLK